MTPSAAGLIAVGNSFLTAAMPKLSGEIRKRWQSFNWQTAQLEYRRKIEDDYGTTRVLGKLDAIPIDEIFTDVYLHDELTAYRRFNIHQLDKDPKSLEDERERLNGFELVKGGECRRLYILGKPGAGKTTFLRYIALQASRNEIEKIPVFVSLKDWADSDLELMPFLVKQFDICRFPDSQPLIEYILDTGQACVLFDGLDETQQEGGKRDRIIGDIRDFSRKYDKSQILLTCRVAATDYTFDKFAYVEVADLTGEQVNRYIEKWFEGDDKRKRQFKQEFDSPDNERLREMANTPILLSLVCLNYDETGCIPQRRVELYERGINALLYKWDASRNIKRDDIRRSIRGDEIYKNLSTDRKQHLFSRIAFETFEKNRYFIPKKELAAMIVQYLSQLPGAMAKEDIEGEFILKAIEAQHGILIERAADIYSFSHLSFQEYFTAKYIFENAAEGSLKKLLTAENITDKRWREVIINTASFLNNADKFFALFQKKNKELFPDDEKISQLFSWAQSKIESVEKHIKPVAVRAYYINADLSLERLRVINEVSFNYPHAMSLAEVYEEIIENTFAISNSFINAGMLDKIDKPLFVLDFDLYYFILVIFHNRAFNGVLKDSDFERRISAFREMFNEMNKTLNIGLLNALLNLPLPSVESKQEDWKIYLKNLRKFVQLHRNIAHEREFSIEQLDKLNDYFYANELLLRCLKVAVVSDRQAIEDGLLLPPAED